ncbi:tRNA threonylcarbamoyladenosine biosynthesis protein TsaB [Jezberella montanilacus]|uniref:[Ribosomal protein bS18]-alanine N-acetyltransferase n=1 Tax=Jezberella montanilacus TaxID=323426 RepID=A0A2T0XF95_9BURK|nr:tRNA (adenosine(37)-N6)-threonylcarbamoyltransferase complex dimerization subunit type 1 TsaB [Jezberella montanilacus]PRY97619.1 tRNA threonylcarbamoyladenosine biosynthesis protein TsaB [Jezberella montanilacus]
MTVLLALETSTQTCSVTLLLARSANVILDQRTITGSTGHAQHLLPLVDDLLMANGVKKRDLTAVAFDQGPGAFTGLRLACGVAQGLGLALNLPLIPIGALLAVAAAAQAKQGSLIVSALDARMDEMYVAAYLSGVQGQLVELQPPVLVPASDAHLLIATRREWWVRNAALQGGPVDPVIQLIGEGWKLPAEYSHKLLRLQGCVMLNHTELPHADWVARLARQRLDKGQVIAPEHAAPLYLRDKVAFTTIERAQGDGGNPRASLRQNISLLPMTSADLIEVLEIERAVQSFPWTEKNFKDSLIAGDEAWVVRDQNRMLGFCVAMGAPDVTHILVVAVAKDAQRQGIATMLLEQVSRHARARSAEGLLLEVRPSNAAARAFYERYGFEQIGIRNHYYPAGRGGREDALVLKKVFLGAE